MHFAACRASQESGRARRDVFVATFTPGQSTKRNGATPHKEKRLNPEPEAVWGRLYLQCDSDSVLPGSEGSWEQRRYKRTCKRRQSGKETQSYTRIRARMEGPLWDS